MLSLGRAGVTRPDKSPPPGWGEWQSSPQSRKAWGESVTASILIICIAPHARPMEKRDWFLVVRRVARIFSQPLKSWISAVNMHKDVLLPRLPATMDAPI